jgi:hypothetical protein
VICIAARDQKRIGGQSRTVRLQQRKPGVSARPPKKSGHGIKRELFLPRLTGDVLYLLTVFINPAETQDLSTH